MKKYLSFLLSFVVISIVLFFLQDAITFGYEVVLLYIISLLDQSYELQPYYASSFRLIIFTALLLATPRVSIKRRLAFIGCGILSFLFLDLLSFLIWTTPPPPPEMGPVAKSHIVYSLVWRMLGHWVLPFIFWILMAKELLLDLFAPTAQNK